MRKTIITATLALGVLGCGKGEGDKKPPEAAADASATGTEATAPDPAAATDAAATDPAAADPAGSTAGAEPDVAPEAAAATDVPTAEDFEEKAAKDVDKTNLEQEVTKMEKELGAKAPKK
jgi:hypothetical protein